MLETINYNKVDPVIQWAHIFVTVATIIFTFSFLKKLRIPKSCLEFIFDYIPTSIVN